MIPKRALVWGGLFFLLGCVPAGSGLGDAAFFLPAQGGPANTPPPPGIAPQTQGYYSPYYAPPAPAFQAGIYTAVKGGVGLVVPEAWTLGIGVMAGAAVDFNFGAYSVGLDASYYSLEDDSLGGQVDILPIQFTGKVWTDDPGFGWFRGFIGLGLGPIIANHSRPDVVYDSTVGVTFSAGLELSPAQSFIMGMESGYTINKPGITIGGTPGDENLDVFYLKAYLGGTF